MPEYDAVELQPGYDPAVGYEMYGGESGATRSFSMTFSQESASAEDGAFVTRSHHRDVGDTEWRPAPISSAVPLAEYDDFTTSPAVRSTKSGRSPKSPAALTSPAAIERRIVAERVRAGC